MDTSLTVEPLKQYDSQDLADIGQLLHVLSPHFSGAPASPKLLDEIISSPHHEQFVARHEGKIIGIATLSITIGMGAGRKAYLEDFVVDLTLRRLGIGKAMWDEMSAWCRAHKLKMHFTSNATREEAHSFYLKNGAYIYDTVVFNYDPDNLDR